MIRFNHSNLAATLMCAASFMTSVSANAQECLTEGVTTTPTENFESISTDALLDNTSDLIWKRCAEGQSWDGTTCNGEAVKYTWQEALQLAARASNEDLLGWRLPNVKELATLTERSCVRPAINSVLFPSTPSDDFWTSTPSVDDPDRAWVVAFFNASHSIKEKERCVYVRLVRTFSDE